MPFNLLLLPLIGGFIFLTRWNYTVYFAKRLDKERLLLHASLTGLILLSISFALSTLIVSRPTWPGFYYLLRLRHWWAWHTPSYELSGVSTFALLLGVFAPSVLNRWPFGPLWTQPKMIAKAIEDYGSPMEKLLLKAVNENKYVMVTLKSGKVYIGRVASTPPPDDDRAFQLLPLKSGHREDGKHRVELTTHYDEAFDMMLEWESDPSAAIKDFGVVIPVREVLTATLFRPDLYSKYFPRKTLID
jgi:hypothetical protein